MPSEAPALESRDRAPPPPVTRAGRSAQLAKAAAAAAAASSAPERRTPERRTRGRPRKDGSITRAPPSPPPPPPPPPPRNRKKGRSRSRVAVGDEDDVDTVEDSAAQRIAVKETAGRRRSTSRRKSNTKPDPDPEPEPEAPPPPHEAPPSPHDPWPGPLLAAEEGHRPGSRTEADTPQTSSPPSFPSDLSLTRGGRRSSPSSSPAHTEPEGGRASPSAQSSPFSPLASPQLRLEDEDSLSPLPLSEDSGGSPAASLGRMEEWLKKQCAFCYRGDDLCLGQGRLVVFGPTPGYIPLHVLNRRASPDRDNDCYDHSYRGDHSPPRCSSPEQSDPSSSEFIQQLGPIGLPLDINVQSLFDPTGQCCAHLQCAAWSECVCPGEGQSLLYVDKAIDSGSTQMCSFCGWLGATLRCQEPGCGRSYHFVCAAAAGAHLDWKDRHTLCSRHTHRGLSRCVSCSGSSDVGDLLMCSCCGYCYHGSCLDPPLVPSPLCRAGWQCPKCRMCQSCRLRGDDSQLLLCERCGKVYHSHCLTPPLDHTPSAGWSCKVCRVCRRCGVRSSGQWANHPFLCVSCDPALPCPECGEVPNLSTAEDWETCSYCFRSVHAECLVQSRQSWTRSEGYLCSSCSPSTHAPPLNPTETTSARSPQRLMSSGPGPSETPQTPFSPSDTHHGPPPGSPPLQSPSSPSDTHHGPSPGPSDPPQSQALSSDCPQTQMPTATMVFQGLSTPASGSCEVLQRLSPPPSGPSEALSPVLVSRDHPQSPDPPDLQQPGSPQSCAAPMKGSQSPGPSKPPQCPSPTASQSPGPSEPAKCPGPTSTQSPKPSKSPQSPSPTSSQIPEPSEPPQCPGTTSTQSPKPSKSEQSPGPPSSQSLRSSESPQSPSPTSPTSSSSQGLTSPPLEAVALQDPLPSEPPSSPLSPIPTDSGPSDLHHSPQPASAGLASVALSMSNSFVCPPSSPLLEQECPTLEQDCPAEDMYSLVQDPSTRTAARPCSTPCSPHDQVDRVLLLQGSRSEPGSPTQIPQITWTSVLLLSPKSDQRTLDPHPVVLPESQGLLHSSLMVSSRLPSTDHHSPHDVQSADHHSSHGVQSADHQSPLEVQSADHHSPHGPQSADHRSSPYVHMEHHQSPPRVPSADHQSPPRVPSADHQSPPRIPSADHQSPPRVPSADHQSPPRVPSADHQSPPRVPSADNHSPPQVPSADHQSLPRVPSADHQRPPQVLYADHQSPPRIPSADHQSPPQILSADHLSPHGISSVDHQSPLGSLSPHTEAHPHLKEFGPQTQPSSVAPERSLVQLADSLVTVPWSLSTDPVPSASCPQTPSHTDALSPIPLPTPVTLALPVHSAAHSLRGPESLPGHGPWSPSLESTAACCSPPHCTLMDWTSLPPSGPGRDLHVSPPESSREIPPSDPVPETSPETTPIQHLTSPIVAQVDPGLQAHGGLVELADCITSKTFVCPGMDHDGSSLVHHSPASFGSSCSKPGITVDHPSPASSPFSDPASPSQASALLGPASPSKTSALLSSASPSQTNPLPGPAGLSQAIAFPGPASPSQNSPLLDPASPSQNSPLPVPASPSPTSPLPGPASPSQDSPLPGPASLSQASALLGLASLSQTSPLLDTASHSQNSPLSCPASPSQASPLPGLASPSQASPLPGLASPSQASALPGPASPSQASALHCPASPSPTSPLSGPASPSQASPLPGLASPSQASALPGPASPSQASALHCPASPSQTSPLPGPASLSQNSPLLDPASPSQTSPLPVPASPSQNSPFPVSASPSRSSPLPGPTSPSQGSALPGPASPSEANGFLGPASPSKTSAILGPPSPSQTSPLTGPASPAHTSPLPGPASPSLYCPLLGPASPSLYCPLLGSASPSQPSPLAGPASPGQTGPLPGPANLAQIGPLPGPANSAQTGPLPGPASPSQTSPLPGPASPSQTSPLPGPASPAQTSPLPGPASPAQTIPLSGSASPLRSSPLSGPASLLQSSPLPCSTGPPQNIPLPSALNPLHTGPLPGPESPAQISPLPGPENPAQTCPLPGPESPAQTSPLPGRVSPPQSSPLPHPASPLQSSPFPRPVSPPQNSPLPGPQSLLHTVSLPGAASPAQTNPLPAPASPPQSGPLPGPAILPQTSPVPGPANPAQTSPLPGPTSLTQTSLLPGPASPPQNIPLPGPRSPLYIAPLSGPASPAQTSPLPGPASPPQSGSLPGPASPSQTSPLPGPASPPQNIPLPGPRSPLHIAPLSGPASPAQTSPLPGPASPSQTSPLLGPAVLPQTSPVPGPASPAQTSPLPGPTSLTQTGVLPGPARPSLTGPLPGPASPAQSGPLCEPQFQHIGSLRRTAPHTSDSEPAGPVLSPCNPGPLESGPVSPVEPEQSSGPGSPVQAEPSPGPSSPFEPEPSPGSVQQKPCLGSVSPVKPESSPSGSPGPDRPVEPEQNPGPVLPQPVVVDVLRHCDSSPESLGFGLCEVEHELTETPVVLGDQEDKEGLEDPEQRLQEGSEGVQKESKEAVRSKDDPEGAPLVELAPASEEEISFRHLILDHSQSQSLSECVTMAMEPTEVICQSQAEFLEEEEPTRTPRPISEEEEKDPAGALRSISEEEEKKLARAPRPIGEEEEKKLAETPRLISEEEEKEPARAPRPIGEEEEPPGAPRPISEEEEKDPAEAPRPIGEEEEKKLTETPRLISEEEEKEPARAPRPIREEEGEEPARVPQPISEEDDDEAQTGAPRPISEEEEEEEEPARVPQPISEEEEEPVSPVLDLDSSLDLEVMDLMGSSPPPSLLHLSSPSPPMPPRRGKGWTLRPPPCALSRPADDLSLRLRMSPFSTEASPETSPSRTPDSPTPLRESPLSKLPAPPATLLPLTPKIGMGKPAISKRKFSPGRVRLSRQSSWWSNRPASSQDSMGEGGGDSPKPHPPDSPLWSMKVGRGSGFPGRRRSRGGGGRGGRGRSRLKTQESPSVCAGSGHVEMFQVKEEEENSMHNTVVMFSTSDHFTLKQDMCVVCGSFGQGAEGRLLACSQCGQCYHPYCVNVKITRVVLTKGWRCLECTVCEACGQASDPGRLLLCDDCDISYHTYCLQPPLLTVPKGAWKCKWCVWCVQCGSTSPGLHCEWQNNYSCCGPCSSLTCCPLCQRTYSQDELVLQCQQCDRWVHASCQGLSSEDEVELAADEGFDCALCQTHDRGSHGRTDALGSFMAQVVSRTREHEIKTYTQDGVCLTESGLSHLQSLVEPLTSPRRYRRCKPKLKLRIINQNSVSVLQTPESELQAELDPSRADLECEMKSDSSPERDHAPNDDVSRDAEVTDGNKKRKRKPYRPGIGGFMVRQRGGRSGPSRIKLCRRDSADTLPAPDEGLLDADVSMETVVPGDQSTDKVKKRYRKKKTKLEEEFPSYLQDAFFGRDLLDRSRQVDRGTVPETAGGQSGPPVPPAVTMVTSTNSKPEARPMSEDALLDLSSVLITEPHILSSRVSAGLDVTPVATEMPDGGGRVRPGPEEPLDAILSPELDKMVSDGDILSKLYKIPELEGKDVEEVFTAVLSPNSSNNRPEQSQHTHNSAVQYHRLPLNGLVPPALVAGGGASGLFRAALDSAPGSAPDSQVLRGCGQQDGPSAAQRGVQKWEKEESLGATATVAPVLYCNTNFPQLREQYPDWSTRMKQIAKLWRKASAQDRAPYVQKARDNRAAQRISKVSAPEALKRPPHIPPPPPQTLPQPPSQPSPHPPLQAPPTFDPVSMDPDLTLKDPLRPKESEQEQEWKLRQQMRQKTKQLAKLEACQKLEQVKMEQLQRQRGRPSPETSPSFLPPPRPPSPWDPYRPPSSSQTGLNSLSASSSSSSSSPLHDAVTSSSSPPTPSPDSKTSGVQPGLQQSRSTMSPSPGFRPVRVPGPESYLSLGGIFKAPMPPLQQEMLGSPGGGRRDPCRPLDPGQDAPFPSSPHHGPRLDPDPPGTPRPHSDPIYLTTPPMLRPDQFPQRPSPSHQDHLIRSPGSAPGLSPSPLGPGTNTDQLCPGRQDSFPRNPGPDPFDLGHRAPDQITGEPSLLDGPLPQVGDSEEKLRQRQRLRQLILRQQQQKNALRQEASPPVSGPGPGPGPSPSMPSGPGPASATPLHSWTQENAGPTSTAHPADPFGRPPPPYPGGPFGPGGPVSPGGPVHSGGPVGPRVPVLNFPRQSPPQSQRFGGPPPGLQDSFLHPPQVPVQMRPTEFTGIRPPQVPPTHLVSGLPRTLPPQQHSIMGRPYIELRHRLRVPFSPPTAPVAPPAGTRIGGDQNQSQQNQSQHNQSQQNQSQRASTELLLPIDEPLEDSAVKDLEDVEVKDLVDLNLNLDPEDGKEDLDLHLDDFLLSGKFDLIAYADPELDLVDKKDLFNEELDLDPADDREVGGGRPPGPTGPSRSLGPPRPSGLMAKTQDLPPPPGPVQDPPPHPGPVQSTGSGGPVFQQRPFGPSQTPPVVISPGPPSQNQNKSRPLLLEEQPLLLQDLLDQERQEQQQQKQMQALIRHKASPEPPEFPSMDPIMKAKMVALKGINKVMSQGNLGLNRFQPIPGNPGAPEGPPPPPPPQLRLGQEVQFPPQLVRPLPPSFGTSFVNETQRRQYEEWLGETRRLLQMQQRLLEEQITAHRKAKKALSAKQRTAKRAGRSFPEEDSAQLLCISQQQGAVQRQLEQIRKQQKDHAELIEDYHSKHRALQPPTPQAQLAQPTPTPRTNQAPPTHMTTPTTQAHLAPPSPRPHMTPPTSQTHLTTPSQTHLAPPSPRPHLAPPSPRPHLAPPSQTHLAPPSPRPHLAPPSQTHLASPSPQPHLAPPTRALLAPPSPRPLLAPPSPRPHLAPPSPRPHLAPPSPRPLLAPPSPRPHLAPPSQAHLAPPSPRPHVALPSQTHLAPPSPRPHVAPPSQAHLAPPSPRPHLALSSQAHLAPPTRGPCPGVPVPVWTPGPMEQAASPHPPTPPSVALGPGTTLKPQVKFDDNNPFSEGFQERERRERLQEQQERQRVQLMQEVERHRALQQRLDLEQHGHLGASQVPGGDDVSPTSVFSSELPPDFLLGAPAPHHHPGPSPVSSFQAVLPGGSAPLQQLYSNMKKSRRDEDVLAPPRAGLDSSEHVVLSGLPAVSAQHRLSVPGVDGQRRNLEVKVEREEDGACGGRVVKKEDSLSPVRGGDGGKELLRHLLRDKMSPPTEEEEQPSHVEALDQKKLQRCKRAGRLDRDRAPSKHKRRRKEEEEDLHCTTSPSPDQEVHRQLPLMEPVLQVDLGLFPPYGSLSLGRDSRLSGSFGNGSLDGVTDFYSHLIYKQNNLSNPPTPPASLPPTPPPVARQKLLNGFASTDELKDMSEHDVKGAPPLKHKGEELLSLSHASKMVDVPASLPTPPHNNQEELRVHGLDGFVPSSSPESLADAEISRYPDLSWIKLEPPSPCPSPPFPITPSAWGKAKLEVKAEPNLQAPPSCSSTDLVTIAITLNPVASQNVSGVMAAVAHFLRVSVPLDYRLSLEAPQGSVVNQSLTGCRLQRPGVQHGGSANRCSFCKVLLGPGVQIIKELKQEAASRPGPGLVFCSPGCLENQRSARVQCAAPPPPRVQHQYANNMSSITVHSLPHTPLPSSPPCSPPLSFPPASAVTMETKPRADRLKVKVKLKPRPRAVPGGDEPLSSRYLKRARSPRWRRWSLSISLSRGPCVPSEAVAMPTEDELSELLQKSGSSLRPDPLPRDQRRCCFCHQQGDGQTDGPARLLNLDLDLWVHLNCALWSSEVYETQAGALINVELALRRGLALRCVHCQRTGATSGCNRLRCTNTYHFTCALQASCTFFKDKTMLCPLHKPRSCSLGGSSPDPGAPCDPYDSELRCFSVFRRVFVQRDEARQIAAVVQRGERQHTFRVGALLFRAVGRLLPHQMASFHNRAAIFPVGYHANRFYWSMRHSNRRCKYVCSIEERDGRPLFRLKVVERGHQDLLLTGDTPKAVWDQVLEPLSLMRTSSGTLKLFPLYLKGEDLFGLTATAVTRIIESLPGVEACDGYSFRFGRNPLMEWPLAFNPSGSARTEAKACQAKRLLSSVAPRCQGSVGSIVGAVPGVLSLSPGESLHGIHHGRHSKSSQYRRMKAEWKSNVYLARSRIQGLGLYAARDIEKCTMVIEYIGTIIRSEVANRKERLYEAQNRGVYMFRIDNDYVIDATITGGPARYINHSCAPNCITEVVSVEKENKIIISSCRRIQRGEELSYDYKFDLEDDQHKIPCHCGALNCHKWMN